MGKLRFAVLAWIMCVTLADGADWGKVSADEWAVAPPAAMPDAPVVILFDRGLINVSPEKIETTIHIRMKVFSRSGAEKAGDMDIAFYSDDKISGLEAQTILPDGSKLKVDPKQIFEKKSGELRTRTFAFRGADSGAILEYRYRLTSEDFTLDSWYFQSRFYCLESQLSLRLAPGFTYSTSFYSIPTAFQQPVAEKSIDVNYPGSSVMTYTWTMKNLKPMISEPYMALAANYRPAIRNELSTYHYGNATRNYLKSWPQIGKDAEVEFKELLNAKGLRDLADRLASDLTDPREISRVMYQWVMDSISLETGSGHSSHGGAIPDILSKRTANGLDRNIFLWALLRVRKLPAYPVLISTRDFSFFDPQVISLRPLNQRVVVVEIDSGFFFLDASSRHTPFSTLAPGNLVTSGLLIDGEKTQPIAMNLPSELSVRRDSIDATVDDEGKMHCRVVTRLSGYFVPLYGDWLDNGSVKEGIAELYGDVLGRKPDIADEKMLMDPAGNLLLSYSAVLENQTRVLSPDLLIRIPYFAFSKNPFTDAKRLYPIDFNFPRRYETSVLLTLPAKYPNVILPSAVDVQKDGLSYTASGTTSPGQVRFLTRLDLTSGLYSPSRYGDVRDLFGIVASVAQTEMIAGPGH